MAFSNDFASNLAALPGALASNVAQQATGLPQQLAALPQQYLQAYSQPQPAPAGPPWRTAAPPPLPPPPQFQPVAAVQTPMQAAPGFRFGARAPGT